MKLGSHGVWRGGIAVAVSMSALACGPEYVAASPPPSIEPRVITPARPVREETDDDGNPLSVATACDRGDAQACTALCDRHVISRGGDASSLPKASGVRAARWCARGCEHDDASACNSLGRLYLDGFGVPRDRARARALFAPACDRGNLLACVNLGIDYFTGDGHVPEDAPRAVALLTRACDGGLLLGCADLANAYALGQGVAKDSARAIALSSRACDGDVAAGCIILANYYEWGEQGLARDSSKAFALITRACTLGSPRGCSDSGDHYAVGIGAPKDEARAFTLFTKACEDGVDKACFSVGLMYALGRVVTADYARAATYYGSSCERGIGDACTNLGAAYQNGQGVEKDVARAVTLFEQGCELRSVQGCLNIGNMYVRGDVIARDLTKAERPFQRACEIGDIVGCRDQVLLTEFRQQGGVDAPAATAAKLAKRCDGGRAASCVALGLILEGGMPEVKKDGARALELYRKGCKAATPSPLACKEVARFEKK